MKISFDTDKVSDIAIVKSILAELEKTEPEISGPDNSYVTLETKEKNHSNIAGIDPTSIAGGTAFDGKVSHEPQTSKYGAHRCDYCDSRYEKIEGLMVHLAHNHHDDMEEKGVDISEMNLGYTTKED